MCRSRSMPRSAGASGLGQGSAAGPRGSAAGGAAAPRPREAEGRGGVEARREVEVLGRRRAARRLGLVGRQEARPRTGRAGAWVRRRSGRRRLGAGGAAARRASAARSASLTRLTATAGRRRLRADAEPGQRPDRQRDQGRVARAPRAPHPLRASPGRQREAGLHGPPPTSPAVRSLAAFRRGGSRAVAELPRSAEDGGAALPAGAAEPQIRGDVLEEAEDDGSDAAARLWRRRWRWRRRPPRRRRRRSATAWRSPARTRASAAARRRAQHGGLPGRRLGHGAGGHLPDHGAAGAARRHAAARRARAAGPRPALTRAVSRAATISAGAGQARDRRRRRSPGGRRAARASWLARGEDVELGRHDARPGRPRSSTTLRQDQTSWLQKPAGTGPRRFSAAAAQTPVRQSACSASASPTTARLPRPAPISRSAAASSMPSSRWRCPADDPRRDQRQPELLLPLQPPGRGRRGRRGRRRPCRCRRSRTAPRPMAPPAQGVAVARVKKTSAAGIVAVAGAVGDGAAPDRLRVGEGDLGAAHDRVGAARRHRHHPGRAPGASRPHDPGGEHRESDRDQPAQQPRRAAGRCGRDGAGSRRTWMRHRRPAPSRPGPRAIDLDAGAGRVMLGAHTRLKGLKENATTAPRLHLPPGRRAPGT